MENEIKKENPNKPVYVPQNVKNGAGPLFEDDDVDFDCEEAWGWNHANPGYFKE